MSKVRTRHTAAEMAIRSELHARGLRYRVNYRLPEAGRCRPDIAFTRRRVAVFIDGCFWHRCPEHATFPKSNAEWWAKKLERNVQRDNAINQALREAGWKVIRVWEHESAEDAVDLIVDALNRSASG
jgi:DNA mismatch endonuclease (patch repair protein)